MDHKAHASRDAFDQALARELEVSFVLTQRPDAFRNATGIKQYFKSDSLTGVARSIWRVAQPEAW